MQCPACGQANPTEARFCMGCGAEFALACAHCGSALPGEARFCFRCGRPIGGPREAPPPPAPRSYTPKHLAEEILTQRAALEGERKQVTVLFVDVRGSLALAEQVGAEAWHGILDRFFQILADGVHRFEGTVNQYTGDGIMALFGAPIAHEDHARRAGYAALHLRDALRRYGDELRLSRGLDFAVRMGLNSGEVVVGKIGDDLRMDYTAQGHTVGLAARMEQLAGPDRIYLTDQTARLIEGYFRLHDLGTTQVKGVEGEVRVHELEGAGPLRTRFEVARRRGLSRFVGRGDEMATLEAALGRALEGQGQVVGVVGEAGVGKSRLCFEFAARCRARGVAVYEARGVAHGKSVPLLPVLELLRAYFGIQDADDERSAREKVAGRMLLLDRSLEEALPLLFDFLGIPDPERPAPRLPPEARQRRLFEVMRRLLHARSRREAAVFVFEDLHWTDAASETFLENVVEALPGSRTLLLVDFRPEYQAAWTRKSYYHQLPLLPLSAAAVGELLGSLLGADPSLGDLDERIQAHTGGNPFFVEESVRALADSGVLLGGAGHYRLAAPLERLAIPPTVQAVLAARIDRLPEREKRLLGTAAVIGKRVPKLLLERVAALQEAELAEALHALVAAELLYEEALYPEAVYAFAHPLTQEVAYGAQLGEPRRRSHAAVARALEGLDGNRLDERAALLAHHWERADDRLAAARWHARAAVWAGTNHAADAVLHWGRVRALLDGVPESRETLALALEARAHLIGLGGWTASLGDEDVARLFEEGEALAARSGDPRSQARLLQIYGTSRVYAGAVSEAVAALQRAKRIADELGDPELRVAVRWYLADALGPAGPMSEDLATVEEQLELQAKNPQLGRAITGIDTRAPTLAKRGRLLMALGRLTEGREDLERARDLARRGDDPQAAAIVAIHLAIAALPTIGARAGEETLASARSAVEAAERTGTAGALGLAYWVLGASLVRAERWSEAREALERALAGGTGNTRLLCTSHLARAWLGLGDVRKARSLAEEGVARTRRAGAAVLELAAQLYLAQVLLGTDGGQARQRVEEALARAHALVEETGYRSLEPLVHLGRAELAQALGDEATRARELGEVQRLARELSRGTGASQPTAERPAPDAAVD
jgi:class 3 adenylate cyclase/tetratricopeptide (TPR) repeat protein